MTKTLTIIHDHRESEGFAFDIVFQGKRFDQFRGIADTRFEANIVATARRFGGYRYINARKAFMPAWDFAGDRAAAFVAQLEREGWTVQNVGHLPASLISEPVQIAA